jgi:hypothetical protein
MSGQPNLFAWECGQIHVHVQLYNACIIHFLVFFSHISFWTKCCSDFLQIGLGNPWYILWGEKLHTCTINILTIVLYIHVEWEEILWHFDKKLSSSPAHYQQPGEFISNCGKETLVQRVYIVWHSWVFITPRECVLCFFTKTLCHWPEQWHFGSQ